MNTEPFRVKDCSLIALSTGKHARSLREFATHLQSVPIASVYHHFWGTRLQPRFDEPEYQNDLASWVRHGLHDPVLSEQLAVLDPTDYPDLEELRRDVVDIIEQRLASDDRVSWVQAQYPFSFVLAQTVIFDSTIRIASPEEFASAMPRLTLGSVFFHFIDARRRPFVRMDDFRTWLTTYWPGYDGLIQALADVEPYFCTLAELRDRLTNSCRDYFAGGIDGRQTRPV
ncbi:hypothetical protein HZB60_12525 [candidate division KSB1 bacterium]|nr:hypothetical protein [candidate division KSB1 bacterium]